MEANSREFALQNFPEKWEKGILNLIARSYKTKYASYVKILLNEVKILYRKETNGDANARTHELSRIPVESSFDNREYAASSDLYFARDREKCREMFGKRRDSLAKRYYLSHEAIRSIVRSSHSVLPTIVCDVATLRDCGALQLRDLREKCAKETRRSAIRITNRFHAEAVRIISSSRSLRKNSAINFARFLKCATNVFLQLIVNVVVNSMERTIKALENDDERPTIEFELVFEDGELKLRPPIDSVFRTFHEILRNIENVADYMDPLEKDEKRKTRGKSLAVKISQCFSQMAHERLQRQLEGIYKPIVDHLTDLNERFFVIRSSRGREEVSALIAENSKQFDVYLAQLRKYKIYHSEATKLRDSVRYHCVGLLNQSAARNALANETLEITRLLEKALVDYHRNYNDEICRDFERLRFKALNIPRNAKDLIDLTEYVSGAARTLINELEQRIRHSFAMLGALFEFATLTDDHLRLNGRTVAWLTAIEPIFAQNNTLTEAMKSEFEEELQRRTSDLNAEVDGIFPKLIILNDMDDLRHVDDYLQHYEQLLKQVSRARSEADSINDEETLLNFPLTEFPKVVELEDVVLPFYRLMKIVWQWQTDNSVWLDGPFEYLDSSVVEEKTSSYFARIAESNKEFRTRIKMDLTSSKCFKFAGIADDPDPMQQPAPLKLCWQVLRDIENFQRYLPLVKCVCNRALAQRHWRQMSQLSGCDLAPNAGTTLRKFVQLNLMENIERYEMISARARKELELGEKLCDMKRQWDSVSFRMRHDEHEGFASFENFDEIQRLLEHQSVEVDEMSASAFVNAVKSELAVFSTSLLDVRQILGAWTRVQRQQISVQSIFLSGGAAVERNLREEAFVYERIRVALMDMESAIAENPTFREIRSRAKEMLRNLREIAIEFDAIMNAVRNYLNDKRSRFARFFFLSDEQIQEILYEYCDREKLQASLRKCFPGVRKVKLDSGNFIRSIVGQNGEELRLGESLQILANVRRSEEEWLIDLEKQLRNAVYCAVEKCCTSFSEKSLIDWVSEVPTMAIISASCVHWTSKVHESYLMAYDSMSLKEVQTDYSKFLQSLITKIRKCEITRDKITRNEITRNEITKNEITKDEITRNGITKNEITKNEITRNGITKNKITKNEITRNEITKNKVTENEIAAITRKERKILSTLLILTLRQKEIIDSLLENNVSDLSDFEWTAQLRHYWQNNSDIKVSLCNATINYGYEYNNHIDEHFINTPLTDRCMRSLIEAYRFHLYTVVVGPSASGKGATIKRLANVLALQHRAFNVTQTFTYRCILRLLEGFACTGSWISFTNFHNLSINLLSALSQTIVNIRESTLTAGPYKFATLPNGSAELKVDSGANICFISTILPLRNFAELPDNLRTLFRTVSMMLPDFPRIIETQLLAAGFCDAALLTKKFLSIRELLCDQLSSTSGRHNFHAYLVKDVIAKVTSLKERLPRENEGSLLLRAIIDVISSQFGNEHLLMFEHAIKDVFRGNSETLPIPNYSSFLDALDNVCQKRNLHLYDAFRLKILQLFESLSVRHAFIVTGKAAAGKSEILRVLAEILSSMNGAAVAVEILNAALTSECELFGRRNERTNLWEDGLCSKIFRNFAENRTRQWKWLIFDGQLNEMLLENLRTAMSDDKTLRLASGEEIFMPKLMSLFFEVADLSSAAPSVVSHCAIIYVESRPIDCKFYALSLTKKEKIYVQHEELINSLIDWSLNASLKFITSNCCTSFPVKEAHLALSTLSLFEMYLEEARQEKIERNENAFDHFAIWIQAALALAVASTFGANLSVDCQTKFNDFCVSLWNGSIGEFPRPKIAENFEITLPSEAPIQDHFYVFQGVGNWRHFNDLLKNETPTTDTPFNEIYVPTLASLKFNRLFAMHAKQRKPFVLYGETATGKTAFAKQFSRKKLRQMNYVGNFFSFFSLETADKSKSLFLARLGKIQRNLYAPGGNRFAVNFVDDVSLDDDDNFEILAIFELIRQYVDHGYWYDASELEKIFLRDVLFSLVITVRKTKSGATDFRDETFSRFFRHFNVYSFGRFADENLRSIFSNVLLTNLKRNLFGLDVLNTVTSIINATVDVYNWTVENLRPAPTKLQYLFDISDVANTIQGCGLVQKESIEKKVTFLRLWVHEISRAFADRISTEEDEQSFFENVRDSAKKYFKDSFESAFDHLPKFADKKITKESLRYLIFANFGNSGKISSTKRRTYEEIASIESLRNKMASFLADYNDKMKSKLHIFLAPEILRTVAHLCRIFSIPNGNAIIVSSTGKRSIARLAAYVEEEKFFEPTSDSYHNLECWRENLKLLLRSCGKSRNDHVFFVPKNRTKRFHLSDIASLLNHSETTMLHLFSPRERRALVKMARLRAQDGDENADFSAERVMNYFAEECRNKLHIVLAFDLIDARARRKFFSSFSNLKKHFNLICREIWPIEALEEMASVRMKSINVPEELKSNLVKSCVNIHEQATEMSFEFSENFGRPTYVTVSSFFHFLDLYEQLTTKRAHEITIAREKYAKGLRELKCIGDRTKVMRANLAKLKSQLRLSTEESARMTKEMAKENSSVERATLLMKEKEEIAKRKAKMAGKLRKECESDLAVAIPILEDAVVALNTLKPSDITLMKAMKNPPDTVKLVMAAICVMLNIPPEKTVHPVTGKKTSDYWAASKRLLGDMNFLQNLKDYDKDGIPDETIEIIKETYISDKSFLPRVVAKASSAAEGLCKWVRAIVSYDEVAKVVAPKKKNLEIVQKECDEAEAFLIESNRTISALNAKLNVLNVDIRDCMKRRSILEDEVADCEGKLANAEGLLANLGKEENRWTHVFLRLQRNFDDLAGDLTLSCAVIAYASPYDFACRRKLLRKWSESMKSLSVPHSENFDIANVLESKLETTLSRGRGDSLGSEFFRDNVVIVKYSKFWPLLVDPQNEGNRWIRETEKKNGLKIAKLTDRNFVALVKICMKNGNPLMVEEIQKNDEVTLRSVISRNFDDNGGSVFEFSRNFRFYFVARSANVDYSPEIYAKLTVIDFSVTKEMLEEKLRRIILAKEKLQLAEKLERLSKENLMNEGDVKSCEDRILTTLFSANSDILNDRKTIDALNESATLFSTLTKKREEIERAIDEIDEFACVYTNFLKYCVELFCTLEILANFDHMYRFSFPSFARLFVRSIERSNRNVSFERRAKSLKRSFTKNFHESVRRSLFERHRLVYSFLLCLRILLAENETTEEAIRYFCNGNCEIANFCENSPTRPSWLNDDRWREICYVDETFTNFRGLSRDIASNEEIWKNFWRNRDRREKALLLPRSWNDKLTKFEKLILAKIREPDEILRSITAFVVERMEIEENYSAQYKISEALTESTSFNPILFLLPSYTSICLLLREFARNFGRSSRFVSLSMSSDDDDDEKSATNWEELVKSARKNGNWVFLENCHLSVSRLSRVQTILLEFEEPENSLNSSLDFRLWLSSSSLRKFPIGILENCTKIALDAPIELKKIILHSFQSQPVSEKKFIESCPGKDEIFIRFLYGFSFFHATLRERTYFKFQNYNAPYEFDHCDLELTLRELQYLMKQHKTVPINALSYIIGDCVYGGKIVDAFDLKYVRCLLDYCCSEIIMNGSQKLSTFPRPRRWEYGELMKHVRDMATNSSLEFPKFHENSLVVEEESRSEEFWNLVKSTDTSISAKRRQENAFETQLLNAVEEIEREIPKEVDKSVLNDYPCTFLNPLNSALKREIEIINDSLRTMKETFAAVRSVFSGDTIITDSLEETFNDLRVFRVPREWRKRLDDVATKNLSNFVARIRNKINFVNEWTKHEHPWVVPFDALSTHKMFLVASKLMFSRLNNIPINEVHRDFVILRTSSVESFDAQRESESKAVYFISGLKLLDAHWNLEEMKLMDSSANAFYCEMPIVSFRYVKEANISKNVYECPVYVSRAPVDGTNEKKCIMTVPLRTDVCVRHWIIRATALYCQTE